MNQLLIVFLGGGLGTVSRFMLGKLLPYSGEGFPWSTFWANLLGCLLIGVFSGYIIRNADHDQSTIILFATVGFCGGFTTFSSFANENLTFIRTGDYLMLFGYTLLSLVSGLLMVYLGILIEKYFH